MQGAPLVKTKFIRFGNILDVTHGIIVQGNNCIGPWGAGLALQIKRKHPSAFEEFSTKLLELKKAGVELLGQTIVTPINSNLLIVNALTQSGYGTDKRQVNYAAVLTAFESVALLALQTGLDVHYPQVGAGLGGGDWAVLSEIIDSAFQGTQVKRTLWIFEP